MDEKLDSILEYLGVLKTGLDRVEERQASMEDRMTSMEDRMTSMEDRLTSMEDRMTSVENRLTSMEDRMTSVENRLTSMEERQTSMEERQTSMEESIELLARNQNRMEERQIGMENRLTRVEESTELLAQNQNRMEEKLDNFIVETRGEFRHVHSSFDGNRRMIKFVSGRQESTESDVAFLIQKTGQHDTKINHLEKEMKELRD